MLNPAGALPASSHLILTTACDKVSLSRCHQVGDREVKPLASDHTASTRQRQTQTQVLRPTPLHATSPGGSDGIWGTPHKGSGIRTDGRSLHIFMMERQDFWSISQPCFLATWASFFKLSEPWFLCFQVILVPTMETTGGVSASVDVKVLTAPGTGQACNRCSLAIIMSSSSSSPRSPRGFSYTSADRATCW